MLYTILRDLTEETALTPELDTIKTNNQRTRMDRGEEDTHRNSYTGRGRHLPESKIEIENKTKTLKNQGS